MVGALLWIAWKHPNAEKRIESEKCLGRKRRSKMMKWENRLKTDQIKFSAWMLFAAAGLRSMHISELLYLRKAADHIHKHIETQRLKNANKYWRLGYLNSSLANGENSYVCETQLIYRRTARTTLSVSGPHHFFLFGQVFLRYIPFVTVVQVILLPIDFVSWNRIYSVKPKHSMAKQMHIT